MSTLVIVASFVSAWSGMVLVIVETNRHMDRLKQASRGEL